MPRMRILRAKESAAFVDPKSWQRMAVYDSESARHPDYLCRRKAIGNWNFRRTRSATPVKSVPRFGFGDQMLRCGLRLTAEDRTGRGASEMGVRTPSVGTRSPWTCAEHRADRPVPARLEGVELPTNMRQFTKNVHPGRTSPSGTSYQAVGCDTFPTYFFNHCSHEFTARARPESASYRRCSVLIAGVLTCRADR